MQCCAKDENVGYYKAENRTGWAGFCKKYGRTWSATEEMASQAELPK